MARLNKKRTKNNNNGNVTNNSETQENTKDQANKITGKKRKAKSEQGDSFSNRELNKKSCYNLRSNNSGEVKFVSEELCCQSEVDRQKYEKLGLNTALFLSSRVPAKRKQSHISVITISSSDDEIYYQRTADWVANMDVDSPGNLGEELENTTPIGDTVVVSSEDDSFNQHLSKLRVTTPSGSDFKPLYVSTPQQDKSNDGQEHFDSFLTNPLPTKPQNVSSERITQLQGKSSEFYFGNPMSQNDSSPESSSNLPGSNLTGINELSSDLSGALPPSEVQENCNVKVGEASQTPATSNSLTEPVYKIPSKKKSSVKSNPRKNVTNLE